MGEGKEETDGESHTSGDSGNPGMTLILKAGEKVLESRFDSWRQKSWVGEARKNSLIHKRGKQSRGNVHLIRGSSCPISSAKSTIGRRETIPPVVLLL